MKLLEAMAKIKTNLPIALLWGCCCLGSLAPIAFASNAPSPPGGNYDDEDSDILDGQPAPDGLTNRVEREVGTDPLNPDSDGDHIIDGADAVPKVEQMTVLAAPEDNYAIIDLGTEERDFVGLNDSGDVLLQELDPATHKYKGWLWRNGEMQSLPEHIAYLGLLQDGSIYIYGDPSTGDPNVNLVVRNAAGNESNDGYFFSQGSYPVNALNYNSFTTDQVFPTSFLGGLPALQKLQSLYAASRAYLSVLTDDFDPGLGYKANSAQIYGITDDKKFVYWAAASSYASPSLPSFDAGSLLWGWRGPAAETLNSKVWAAFNDFGTTGGIFTGRAGAPIVNDESFAVARLSDDGQYPFVPLYPAPVFGQYGSDVSTANTAHSVVYQGNDQWKVIPDCDEPVDLTHARTPEGPFILGKKGSKAALWCYDAGHLESIDAPITLSNEGGYVTTRRISDNLVVPAGDSIWRNSRKRSVAELCGSPSDWSNFNARFISPQNNIILADATKSGVEHRVLLVPVEITIVHTEKERDVDGNELSNTVHPGKDTLLRDEIADLKIKIPPLGNTDWDLEIDVEPGDVKTQTLGNRGTVQMYDFGTVNNGTVTPLTETNGSTQAGPYDIKLLAPKSGEETFKVVVNEEGKFKIRLKSQDNANVKIDVVSQEFTVEKRIRKYGKDTPSATYDFNKHDRHSRTPPSNGVSSTNTKLTT
jgi:hypothetical protein